MQSYQPDSCGDEGLFGVSGSSKVVQVGLCWVSYQPELCPGLTDDGLLVLSSLSKNITGSLMTQEKTCVLCSLPGSTVLVFFLCLLENDWKLSSWAVHEDCLRSFRETSVIISECYQYKPWAELFWKMSLTVCQLLFVVVAAVKIQACLLDPLLEHFFLIAFRLSGRWLVISVLPYFLYCLARYVYGNTILSHLSYVLNIRLYSTVHQSKHIGQLTQVFSSVCFVVAVVNFLQLHCSISTIILYDFN